jgi:SAM-dependent methyltransferase
VNHSDRVRLVCPRCRGELQHESASLRCADCAAAYPVVAGIPDLRVAPDPWIGLEEDRAKALRVKEATRGEDLEGAVRAYWRLTPSTPTDQAERFTRHVLRAESRSREWLARSTPMEGKPGPWIDLGCGTGDLLSAAGHGGQGVGIDIALRWLVVAQQRLARAGLDASLVCANGEHLPFPDHSFARVLALGLVEHCRDKLALFREVRRVLRPGGTFHFRTVNRFGLLPEPHVGVWGVGYLPRGWADGYVRWRTGRPYGHHWPEGPGALRRALRDAGFGDVEVAAAALLPSELNGRPNARGLAPVYERMRRTPVARRALCGIAPLLETRAVA